jgi:hypothetical protein
VSFVHGFRRGSPSDLNRRQRELIASAAFMVPLGPQPRPTEGGELLFAFNAFLFIKRSLADSGIVGRDCGVGFSCINGTSCIAAVSYFQ